MRMIRDVVAEVMAELEGRRLPHQQLAGAEMMGAGLVARTGDLVEALVPRVREELLPEFREAMEKAQGAAETVQDAGGPLLTVGEAASALGVAENSVRRWVGRWPQVRYRIGKGTTRGRYKVRFGLLQELFQGQDDE